MNHRLIACLSLTLLAQRLAAWDIPGHMTVAQVPKPLSGGMHLITPFGNMNHARDMARHLVALGGKRLADVLKKFF